MDETAKSQVTNENSLSLTDRIKKLFSGSKQDQNEQIELSSLISKDYNDGKGKASMLLNDINSVSSKNNSETENTLKAKTSPISLLSTGEKSSDKDKLADGANSKANSKSRFTSFLNRSPKQSTSTESKGSDDKTLKPDLLSTSTVGPDTVEEDPVNERKVVNTPESLASQMIDTEKDLSNEAAKALTFVSGDGAQSLETAGDDSRKITEKSYRFKKSLNSLLISLRKSYKTIGGIVLLFFTIALGFSLYIFVDIDQYLDSVAEDETYDITIDLEADIQLEQGLQTVSGQIVPSTAKSRIDLTQGENTGFTETSSGVVATTPGDTYTSAVISKRSGTDWPVIVTTVDTATSLQGDYISMSFDNLTPEDTAIKSTTSDVTLEINNRQGVRSDGDGALRLDGGINDYLIARDLADFPREEMTVSYKVKTNGSRQPMFSYATGSNSNEFLIHRTDTLGIYRSTTSYVNTLASVNSEDWVDVMVTWAASDGIARLYVDGQFVSEGAISVGRPLEQGGTLVIGGEQDTLGGGFSADETFTGSIDELNVWERRLTATEIAQFYNGSSSPYKVELRYCSDQDNCENGEFVELAEAAPDSSVDYMQYKITANQVSEFPPMNIDVGVTESQTYGRIIIDQNIPFDELESISYDQSDFNIDYQLESDGEYYFWDEDEWLVSDDLTQTSTLDEVIANYDEFEMIGANLVLVTEALSPDAYLDSISLEFVRASVRGVQALSSDNLVAQVYSDEGSEYITNFTFDPDADILIVEGIMEDELANGRLVISDEQGVQIYADDISGEWSRELTNVSKVTDNKLLYAKVLDSDGAPLAESISRNPAEGASVMGVSDTSSSDGSFGIWPFILGAIILTSVLAMYLLTMKSNQDLLQLISLSSQKITSYMTPFQHDTDQTAVDNNELANSLKVTDSAPISKLQSTPKPDLLIASSGISSVQDDSNQTSAEEEGISNKLQKEGTPDIHLPKPALADSPDRVSTSISKSETDMFLTDIYNADEIEDTTSQEMSAEGMSETDMFLVDIQAEISHDLGGETQSLLKEEVGYDSGSSQTKKRFMGALSVMDYHDHYHGVSMQFQKSKTTTPISDNVKKVEKQSLFSYNPEVGVVSKDPMNSSDDSGSIRFRSFGAFTPGKSLKE